MITIFGDFCQFSAKKLAFFLNANVMINFLPNLALFWVKNADFFAKIFGENILKNHHIGPWWVCKTVAKNVARPNICQNLNITDSVETRSPRIYYISAIFNKLAREKNNLIGEYSPNRVTLIVSKSNLLEFLFSNSYFALPGIVFARWIIEPSCCANTLPM
jgi:hypothetical protein